MKRIWSILPGPTAIKAVEAAVIIVVALVLLAVLFEWAGTLLDSGGAIG